MTRSIVFSMHALLLTVFLPASDMAAAVFSRDWKAPGDGLLTYDDVNQREWLDLTETQLFMFPGGSLEEKYQVVVDATQPGGVFEGFTPARRDDVVALAISSGIDPNSFDGSDAANGIPARALIEFLGPTYSDLSSPADLASTAFLNEFDGPDRVLGDVFVVTDGRSGERRGGVAFYVQRQAKESTAAWLYRQVPEPPTSLLLICIVFCMPFMSRACSE